MDYSVHLLGQCINFHILSFPKYEYIKVISALAFHIKLVRYAVSDLVGARLEARATGGRFQLLSLRLLSDAYATQERSGLVESTATIINQVSRNYYLYTAILFQSVSILDSLRL